MKLIFTFPFTKTILSRFDFELDDITHTFKYIQNEYRFKYPNMIKGSFPLMLCRRCNEVIPVGIDTGAYFSWISKDYMDEHHLEGTEVEAIAYGVHGKEVLKTSMAKSFDLLLDRGFIQLYDVMQGPCSLFPDFTYAAILGNEVFKGRRIRFLNSASMVLFA